MRRVLYILALLDDSDIDWLTIVGERQNIAFGQAIVTERVPIDSLYVILSGKFSVTLEATGIQLNLLSTGEMVGEISLIDSRSPTATVRALAPSVVLCIHRHAINQRLESNKGFAARMYKAIAVFLAQRLRSMTASLEYSGTPAELVEENEAQDEISPDLLDSMSLAGARFHIILERLQMHASR